jgi:beta-galactosidase
VIQRRTHHRPSAAVADRHTREASPNRDGDTGPRPAPGTPGRRRAAPGRNVRFRLAIGCLFALVTTAAAATAVAQAAPAPRSVDFDAGWRFLKADPASAMMPAFDDANWRAVDVPHDWSIEGPFGPQYASGTGFAPGGVGWYRKRFRLGADARGKLVAVEFDGVYANAQVYLNGFVVGGRPFGFSSFECDLTPYVNVGGGDNVLAVRVDHSRYADSRYYTGSGIYRNVRLRVTDRLHVAPYGVYVTTPQVADDSATVRVQTTVENASGRARSVTVQCDVLGPDGHVVGSATSAPGEVAADGAVPIEQDVHVDRPQRWSIGSPTLYTVRTRVLDGATPTDETGVPFGIRTIRFDANTGFWLNDRSVKLKGVCLHHDAGCLGAAVPERVLERRLRLLQELGVNAIRTSHNPPAPELLDLCDRLGLVVMDEALDEFTPAKNKWVTGTNVGTPSHWGYADVFDRWATTDVADMVRRDRDHPCVIIWSIGNEVDYANDPFSDPVLGKAYQPTNPAAGQLTVLGRPLVAAVKRWDATRPVSAAMANVPVSDAVGFADLLDIAGYNYQEPRYDADHARYPKRVLFGSENKHDYKAWVAVRDHAFVAGQFLWTGIDYLGEADPWPSRGSGPGLLDTCGFKKPLGWFRQSLWTDRPMVYLCTSAHPSAPASAPTSPPAAGVRPRRPPLQESWNLPAGSSPVVTCYTNCPRVQLLLNDKPIGTKGSGDAVDGAITWTVPFEPGTLRAVGLGGDGKPACEFALRTAGPATRIELVADAPQLRADGRDVCHIEFRVTDDAGVRAPDAANPVTFKVTGPATLLGIDNGEMTGPTDYAAPERPASHGRGLAMVRSSPTPGAITVVATSPGLASARVDLSSQ